MLNPDIHYNAALHEKLKGTSKNLEFAQMQGTGKILVPANLKVTLH